METVADLHPAARLVDVPLWCHGSAVTSLDVDRAGERVVVAGLFGAQVRLLESGEILCSLESVGTSVVPLGPVVFDAHGRGILAFCVPLDAWHEIPLVRRRDQAPFDGAIITWDARTGARTREIACRSARLLAFSGDRGVAILADRDVVARWDLETGVATGRIENLDPETKRIPMRAESAVTLSGTLAIVSRALVRLEGPPRPSFREKIDFATGAILSRWECASTELVRARDADLVVAANREGTTLLAGQDQDILWQLAGARQAAVSPDGSRFAVWSYDPPVPVYETISRNRAARIEADVRRMAFCPDDRIVIASGPAGRLAVHHGAGAKLSGATSVPSFGRVRIAEPPGRPPVLVAERAEAEPLTFDAKTLAPVDWRPPPILPGAASPDGRWQIEAIDTGNGWRVQVSDRRTGAVRVEPGSAIRVVNTSAFSPDGAIVACGTFVSGIMTWKPETFEVVATYEGATKPSGMLRALAWTADGRSIVGAGDDGTIIAWDVATRAARVVRAADGHAVVALAAGTDGRIAFALDDERHATVWSLDAARAIATLHGHTAPIAGVAFARDGRSIVTSGLDGRLLAFRLEDT